MDPRLLETGDVLHCRGNGIISKLIMWAAKSKLSHSAIFIEAWGQPYVIEAQKNGVNMKSYWEWVKKYGYDFEVHRSPYMGAIKPFSLRASSIIGTTGYDFVSLLIRQPIKIITGKWRKQKFEEKKMYCSEYAAWCHKIPHSHRMSPQDLYDYCMVQGWEIIE